MTKSHGSPCLPPHSVLLASCLTQVSGKRHSLAQQPGWGVFWFQGFCWYRRLSSEKTRESSLLPGASTLEVCRQVSHQERAEQERSFRAVQCLEETHKEGDCVPGERVADGEPCLSSVPCSIRRSQREFLEGKSDLA